jgi:hypothetical protein
LFKPDFLNFFKNYMCEPLLFVKDDNYVDKEFEEANEQNVVVKAWRCTFCWHGGQFHTMEQEGHNTDTPPNSSKNPKVGPRMKQ